MKKLLILSIFNLILINAYGEESHNKHHSKHIKPGEIMKRSKMSHHKSNKVFKKGMRTQKRNIAPAPSRGGYRL